MHAPKVEPQAPAWATEPDGAERVGVRVNPIALNAKQRREFGGINELPRRPSLRRCDQVGYLPRDLLNVGRVEPHGCTR
ncbi:MAG TPA: hypothetical protein VK672_00825 [Solirubrobacteraceae bacterium]|nr:hypothetical protein [Solirubrobacteraceae bacterium]